MKKDLFLRLTYAVYALVAVIMSYEVLNGTVWVSPSKDTEKLITATLMGVSGSIIGYLVIYLSMSFEAIRRNYGKYALRIFRRDFFIWSLCGFFSLILLLGLTSLIASDSLEQLWIWAFNMTCLSFSFGAFLVVPFGIAILRKSGSNFIIERLIASIQEGDFRDPPPRLGLPNDIYWAITESGDNNVDVISNILFHHINENDSKVASQIMLDFFNSIQSLSTAKEADVSKMISRFIDILLTAFDIARRKDDVFTLKMIMYALNSCGVLAAEKKLDKDVIEKLFEAIGRVTKAFIDEENDSLLMESFWTYYHIAENQITENLPPEGEIWETDANGTINNINTDAAWAQSSKYDEIDKGISYDFTRLVDRTFLCKNYYITEDSVRMIRSFIMMIIDNKRMGPVQKFKTGSSLCWNAEKSIKRLIKSTNGLQFGYLTLYLGNSTLLRVLQQNSRFSNSAFSTYISIVRFLLELDYIRSSDIDEMGGFTRLLIAYSAGITKAYDYVKEVLEIQTKIRVHLLMKLKDTAIKETESKEIKEMLATMQNDLKSYLSSLEAKTAKKEALEQLVKSFQI